MATEMNFRGWDTYFPVFHLFIPLCSLSFHAGVSPCDKYSDSTSQRGAQACCLYSHEMGFRQCSPQAVGVARPYKICLIYNISFIFYVLDSIPFCLPGLFHVESCCFTFNLKDNSIFFFLMKRQTKGWLGEICTSPYVVCLSSGYRRGETNKETNIKRERIH